MPRSTTQTLFALGYLLVAVTMGIRGGRVRRDGAAHAERLAWYVLATAVASAGVLRLIAAGDKFSSVVRDHARSTGWYGDRSSAQIVAMIGLVILGLVTISMIAAGRRRGIRRVEVPTLVVVGLLVALALAATRIISLHRLDELLTREILGARVMTFVELGALTMILVGVVRLPVVDDVVSDVGL